MKRNSIKKEVDELSDDMRPEYDFRKLKFVGRGIYAKRFRSGTNIVLLDSDMQATNPDDESINEGIERVKRKSERNSA